MHLLNISSQEWEEAKAYFLANPDAVKLQKSKSGLNRSFIKVNDEIYALALTKVIEEGILGKGAFGIVKVIQNEKGENLAVKIEGLNDEKKNDFELYVMKELGHFKGHATRPLENIKQFLDRSIKSKRYTIIELFEGKNLYEHLRTFQEPLSETQKLIIGTKLAQRLYELHNKRIIHADVKAANYIVDIHDTDIKVVLIDFGYAMPLPKGKRLVRSQRVGTIKYMAPEIAKPKAPQTQGTYSFASDIYALGIIFKDLDLPADIYEKMIERSIKERPSLQEIIQRLIDSLKSISNTDENALKLIADYEQNHKENRPRRKINI